jgi:GNAT superfamily N-acetyltransferase
MKIISINQKNIKEASRLANSIFRSDKPSPGTWFKVSLFPQNYNRLIDKFELKLPLKYFVAVEDKKIIGTIGYYMHLKDWLVANWVGWFCVDPNYRRKGIGDRLFSFITDLTKKQGKKYLRLFTVPSKDKEAQRFYKERGFKLTGRAKYYNAMSHFKEVIL